MKALELKKVLSEFLCKNGTEHFVKVVSDAIDSAGPANSVYISATRENFAKKFDALSKLNLTER